MSGALIIDYLTQGVAASRPAAPDAAVSTLSYYYANDTGVLSFYDWNAAAWVVIGGAAPAEVLIATQTPTATGIVTFSALGSYGSLRITGSGRGTNASTSVIVEMTFNTDTAANYDSQRVYGVGSTALAAESIGGTYIYVADLSSGTAPTNVGSAFDVTIEDYGATVLQKSTIGNYNLKIANSTSSVYRFAVSGFWRSTAAITRIDLTLSAGNWDTGSRVSLYGIVQ